MLTSPPRSAMDRLVGTQDTILAFLLSPSWGDIDADDGAFVASWCSLFQSNPELLWSLDAIHVICPASFGGEDGCSSDYRAKLAASHVSAFVAAQSPCAKLLCRDIKVRCFTSSSMGRCLNDSLQQAWGSPATMWLVWDDARVTSQDFYTSARAVLRSPPGCELQMLLLEEEGSVLPPDQLVEKHGFQQILRSSVPRGPAIAPSKKRRRVQALAPLPRFSLQPAIHRLSFLQGMIFDEDAETDWDKLQVTFGDAWEQSVPQCGTLYFAPSRGHALERGVPATPPASTECSWDEFQ